MWHITPVNPVPAPPQSDAATGEIAGVFVTRQVSVPATCRQLLTASCCYCCCKPRWLAVGACSAPAALLLLCACKPPADAQRLCHSPNRLRLVLLASLQLADDDLGSKDPATIEIEGIW